jgi:hypothetical protein
MIEPTRFIFVNLESDTTGDDSARAIIRSEVRVQKTHCYFNIWEDFRDLDGSPLLYAFTYSLRAQDPGLNPFFRYECHPDVGDPVSDDDEAEGATVIRNTYGLRPHFHPSAGIPHPISRLHYPFQRSERGSIVFSLIAWLDVDLVKRFYNAGRVVSI